MITIVGVQPTFPGISAFIKSTVICVDRSSEECLNQAVDKRDEQTYDQQTTQSFSAGAGPQC
jgi:hypothetical protein